MNVSGLLFYPLHINVMNFSKPMQHLMTIHGNKLLYFLPMQFRYTHGDRYGEDNILKRLKAENIHHCNIQTMKL